MDCQAFVTLRTILSRRKRFEILWPRRHEDTKKQRYSAAWSAAAGGIFGDRYSVLDAETYATRSARGEDVEKLRYWLIRDQCRGAAVVGAAVISRSLQPKTGCEEQVRSTNECACLVSCQLWPRAQAWSWLGSRLELAWLVPSRRRRGARIPPAAAIPSTARMTAAVETALTAGGKDTAQ